MYIHEFTQLKCKIWEIQIALCHTLGFQPDRKPSWSVCGTAPGWDSSRDFLPVLSIF